MSYIEVLSERLGGKLSDRSMVRDLLEFSQLNANINLLKSVGLAQAFCNSKLNRNKQENVETMAGTIFIGNNAPVLLSGKQSGAFHASYVGYNRYSAT